MPQLSSTKKQLTATGPRATHTLRYINYDNRPRFDTTKAIADHDIIKILGIAGGPYDPDDMRIWVCMPYYNFRDDTSGACGQICSYKISREGILYDRKIHDIGSTGDQLGLNGASFYQVTNSSYITLLYTRGTTVGNTVVTRTIRHNSFFPDYLQDAVTVAEFDGIMFGAANTVAEVHLMDNNECVVAVPNKDNGTNNYRGAIKILSKGSDFSTSWTNGYNSNIFFSGPVEPPTISTSVTNPDLIGGYVDPVNSGNYQVVYADEGLPSYVNSFGNGAISNRGRVFAGTYFGGGSFSFGGPPYPTQLFEGTNLSDRLGSGLYTSRNWQVITARGVRDSNNVYRGAIYVSSDLARQTGWDFILEPPDTHPIDGTLFLLGSVNRDRNAVWVDEVKSILYVITTATAVPDASNPSNNAQGWAVARWSLITGEFIDVIWPTTERLGSGGLRGVHAYYGRIFITDTDTEDPRTGPAVPSNQAGRDQTVGGAIRVYDDLFYGTSSWNSSFAMEEVRAIEQITTKAYAKDRNTTKRLSMGSDSTYDRYVVSLLNTSSTSILSEVLGELTFDLTDDQRWPQLSATPTGLDNSTQQSTIQRTWNTIEAIFNVVERTKPQVLVKLKHNSDSDKDIYFTVQPSTSTTYSYPTSVRNGFEIRLGQPVDIASTEIQTFEPYPNTASNPTATWCHFGFSFRQRIGNDSNLIIAFNGTYITATSADIGDPDEYGEIVIGGDDTVSINMDDRYWQIGNQIHQVRICADSRGSMAGAYAQSKSTGTYTDGTLTGQYNPVDNGDSLAPGVIDDGRCIFLWEAPDIK